METNKKLPITAIVAALNDEHWIADFLDTISFCDQILFVDLGYTDNTFTIADSIEGVTAHRHERVPTVEIIHHEFLEKADNDWILVLDPDERITPALRQDIFKLFEDGISDDIGGIYTAWIFYFRNHLLKGTRWGGVGRRKLLLHKERYTFLPIVHRGHVIKEPFKEYTVPYVGDNFIQHFWMVSVRQLLEKHWRYIKIEPKSRYTSGITTSIKEIIKTPFVSFYHGFVRDKGYKDHFVGLFLSLFWSWYETCSLIGLYFYQRKKRKE